MCKRGQLSPGKADFLISSKKYKYLNATHVFTNDTVITLFGTYPIVNYLKAFFIIP